MLDDDSHRDVDYGGHVLHDLAQISQFLFPVFVFAMRRKLSLSTTAAAVAAGGLPRGVTCAAVAANLVNQQAVKRRRINSLDDLADSVAESFVLLDWVTRHKYLGAYSKNKTMFSKLQARLSPDEWLHGKKTGRKISARKIIPLHDYPAGSFRESLHQLSIFESFQRSAVVV